MKLTLVGFYLCVSLFSLSVWCIPDEIRVGGLFENLDVIGRIAFKNALDSVNQDKDILRFSTFVAKDYEVPQYDSFQVGKKVCDLMRDAVLGIFGPRSPETWDHVQSLCDTMDIPHIGTRWDDKQLRGSCLLNLYPHPSVLSQALSDIVVALNWKRFTVIYDTNEGLKRVGDLLRLADYKGYLVTVRQLEEESEEEGFRPVLKRIKVSGEKNIVLECSVDKLYDVLIQSQQVGLMTSEMSYLITSLDMHTIDLEPFKWSGTNITGIRLVDPEDPLVRTVVREWTVLLQKSTESQTENSLSEGEENEEARRKRSLYKHTNGTSLRNFSQVKRQTTEEQTAEIIDIPPLEAALLHDAVTIFANAIHNLESSEFLPRSIDCEAEPYISWDHGISVINYMKMSEIRGLSGLIKFDHQGFRTDFEIDLIELTEKGLVKKGFWNATKGLNTTISAAIDVPTQEGEDLRNQTFIVMIALTHPYGMLKEASQKLTGNDRFEGFGIDLIHELSLISGFNYTFRVQEDKSSGNPDKITGKWNGMIGEVLSGRADLAIADITITRERERDADFTMPFMNLGISILYRKPTKQPPSLFSFLSPFSYEVWGYMMSAYFGVSLLLFVMGRISSYEWRNPYPCIEEPETLENQFTFLNSLWFTMGSLMQQGSDVAPISVSTRMVAAIWWFFTLIMVSSYTANLAAFLTIEVTTPAFRNVEELANQKGIKYGAKKGGSTANFFRDSNVTVYKKMWKFMEANPDVMMASNEAGVERVMNEVNYAFFMESGSIEYEVERKCDLTQIGGLLDNKGYGIVMRKNSTYRNILSTNVVSLQEKGKLQQLKDKWWKEKRGGGACQKESEGGEASELDLDNVGGVFLVMVVGLIFSCFVALAELLYDVYSRDEPFWEEMKEEIRFIMQCHGTTKPVRKPKSSKSSSKSKSSKSMKSNSPEEDNRFNNYNGFADGEPLD